MSFPLIEKKISIGTILELFILLFMVGGAYASLTQGQEHLRENQAMIVKRIDAHLAEVEVMKNQYVRADVAYERHKAILDRLGSMEQDLKEIKRSVR